ncbi:MAG: hypothetical protein VW338_16545, partial [Rhodospirillaceae bacterium]
MKRARNIEELLAWAYREELPKDGAVQFLRPAGFGFGWGAVGRYSEHLTVVDEQRLNRYGLEIDLQANNLPHPDAPRIWRAVQELSDLVVAWPAEWNPCIDLELTRADLVEAGIAAGLARLCQGASSPP